MLKIDGPNPRIPSKKLGWKWDIRLIWLDFKSLDNELIW